MSDGRDSRSAVSLDELRDELRRANVIVYAIGVDGPRPRRAERVDVPTLRRITDPTGGRTEVVRDVRQVDRAVARIADELGRQDPFVGRAAGRARRTLARDPR